MTRKHSFFYQIKWLYNLLSNNPLSTPLEVKHSIPQGTVLDSLTINI